MNDPTSDLEAWAASYRERRRPGPARRRAIRAAVRAGVAIQDRRIRRQRWLGLGVVLAAGVLAALALGRLLDGRALRAGAGDERSLAPHSTPAEEEQQHERREREVAPRPGAGAPAALEPAVAEPSDASVGAAGAPSPTSAAPKPVSRGGAERRSASSTADSAPVASVSDELESMRLLRAAEQRLEHDAAASLRLLERHAQQFPASTLALEREALTVIALCRQGRLEAGRERQQAFLRRNGGSAYAARVRSACEAAP